MNVFDDWTISPALWKLLRPMLHPGMATLETGSGLSTLLIEAAGCRHTALEHDRSQAVQSECVTLAPLVGNPPWYDWQPTHPYDLLLIDGPPQQAGGREGILRIFDRLIHPATIVLLDDTQRPAEYRLADAICRRFRFRAKHHTETNRGFAVLTRWTKNE